MARVKTKSSERQSKGQSRTGKPNNAKVLFVLECDAVV